VQAAGHPESGNEEHEKERDRQSCSAGSIHASEIPSAGAYRVIKFFSVNVNRKQ